MAHAINQLEKHLKPLSEVSNYRIEKGDADPRGYTVMTPDRRVVGRVDDLIIDTSAMKVRYLVVDRDDPIASGSEGTGRILVPVENVDVRRESEHVIVSRFTEEQIWTQPRAAIGDRDSRTLTRAEEELQIGKREVARGEARVGKHVETEHVSQPVTKRREEVVVERRPVEPGARAHASLSEDEVRIPLKEEEVIVEKRPVVKEELVVGKRVVEEHDTVEADLRREEFDVENVRDANARRPATRRER